MKRYEVRYGTPVNFKVVKTEYRDRAEGVFDTAKRFAEKHNLNWTVAIWNDGYLEKSIEINPRLMIAPVRAETSRQPAGKVAGNTCIS